MMGETSVKTKTDVIDLIICFLMDHEKYMDRMMQRLEKLVETLSKEGYGFEHNQAHRVPTRPQLDAFTLTITNPDDFDVKSLKIEWETKHEDPSIMGHGMNLKKNEHTIGKD